MLQISNDDGPGTRRVARRRPSLHLGVVYGLAHCGACDRRRCKRASFSVDRSCHPAVVAPPERPTGPRVNTAPGSALAQRSTAPRWRAVPDDCQRFAGRRVSVRLGSRVATAVGDHHPSGSSAIRPASTGIHRSRSYGPIDPLGGARSSSRSGQPDREFSPVHDGQCQRTWHAAQRRRSVDRPATDPTGRRRRPATSSPRLPGRADAVLPASVSRSYRSLMGPRQFRPTTAQHHDDRQWWQERDDHRCQNPG